MTKTPSSSRRGNSRQQAANVPFRRQTRRIRALVSTVAVLMLLPVLPFTVAEQLGTLSAQEPASLAPFVPTPQDVVDRMLELANVAEGDTVYDLGSGDGRIVITAAQRYGANGVGVDIDPQRIAEATANAERAGVSHLVRFVQQDALQADVSEATVVTLYLLSSSNMKLRPILTEQLPRGARIVSHAFSMGNWDADQVERFTDSRGNTRTLYLWTHDGTVRP